MWPLVWIHIMTTEYEPRVSIIVPTMATTERGPQLLRAVASVLDDGFAPSARVIVCANGNRIDEALVARLRSLPGVTVRTLLEPSLPKAIAHGRSLVRTEFFGFLDDDDELLRDGLAQRLEFMRKSPQFDLVVCNGTRRLGDLETPVLPEILELESDALGALFRQNWLASCGGLYRSSAIGQSYFDDYHDYAEWTWLAYCLAIDGRRIGYLPARAYVINDTPGSRSKSAAYRASYLHLYERMLAKDPSAHIKRQVRSRLGAALHDMSDEFLARGELMQAWQLHWRSLAMPGGLRYASFTRHLLRNAFTSK